MTIKLLQRARASGRRQRSHSPRIILNTDALCIACDGILDLLSLGIVAALGTAAVTYCWNLLFAANASCVSVEPVSPVYCTNV
jgi:hypothetical protein